MGKPLGLGSVKLEVMGWFPVDRQRRYSLAGLRSERYGASEVRQADLPERYSYERTAQAGTTFLSEACEELLRTGLVPAPVKKALEMLGNFATSPLASEVRYPTNVDQRDKEKEHFKWFQFNDGHKERGRTMSPQGQFLKPLAGESSLPGLLELDWDAPPAGRW